MQKHFIELEAPIEELYKQIEKSKETEEKTGVDMSANIADVEEKIVEKRKEIFEDLSPWQRVQLSRHPSRPYTLKYIELMCDDFIELHGDRNFGDDKAIVGGLASIAGQSFIIIGQQKGTNTKTRQERRFGMANPEGYRKALRLMKTAEKFDLPILTLIDTPGAYPGLEAEERGQAEAIARNIYEMIGMKVPIICVVIGEGASGGALGIGVGDRVFMLENTWFTVISPESCSAILWKTADHKEAAAEQLKLTSGDMLGFELVDGVIPEPLGGAHVDYEEIADRVKETVLKTLEELVVIEPQERINQRINKYGAMGIFDE